jgi:hypothetical protein
MVDLTMLPAVIDTMLPGDACLGMPPASEAGVASYFAQHGLVTLVVDFTQLLEEVSIAKCGQAFLTLDAAARLQAINACKLANVRLFSAFLTQVLRAYYTAPAVLRLISAGSVPPFPSGNELPQDDWYMLETVYERGQAYREAP